MKNIGYIRLRKQIFTHELKHMLRQIEHLLLFTLFFLGTAVPALLFISLLAFGIILDNDSSTSLMLFIVWSLLMTQNLLLQIAKQAILGSRYRYFLSSLERGNAKRLLADAVLAFMCNPIMLLYMFVLASISPQNWREIPHGFLFLLLLLVGNLVCLYKPKGLYWFLAAALCSIPLVSTQSLMFGLMVFCVIQLFIIFVLKVRKSLFSSFTHFLPIEWMFWLSLSLGSNAGAGQTNVRGQKSNSLLSACAVATLLIIMTYYSAQNLPEYIQSVNFIGAQFIVLATASLQLSVHKIMTTYPLFFASYLSLPSISKRQYWVSIAASFVMLLVASMVLDSPVVLIHMLPAIFCIYCAKRSPKFFIAAWMMSNVFTGLLIFSVL